MKEMPRLSDDVVEEEHLLGAEYLDHDGALPADAAAEHTPARFQRFQTSPAPGRRRSSPGWGGSIGGIVWVASSRLNTLLAPFRVQSPRAVIFMLALLKLVITTKAMLLMMPLMRLVEDHICHKHYNLGPSESIPEMKCKEDEVQKQLAWLGGWQSLIGAVVNMIVAFPYGILSDR